MKKLILFACLTVVGSIAFGQSNVTFQVDMNQYGGTFTTPEVNGDFNGWCGNCNVMTDANLDGIWEVTLPLTQDSIEFKYSHDAWGGQENLTPGIPCTKTTSGFTNRFIKINGDTILPIVCWESCMACGPPPDTSMVTFQVDMTQYGGTFTTPEVNGDFNGWCGGCNALTDANLDGIWELTLPLTEDSIEYKFAYDAWAGQEDLTPGTACTKTTSGFTNRFVVLNGDVVLPPVCWDSCLACFVPPPPVDTFMVTFQLDISQYTGTYTTPEVNGEFNGWCGNCSPMMDAVGNDSVWTATIPITGYVGDTVEYKFSYDNWAGQEDLTDGSTCTLTTVDGNNTFVNRFIELGASSVTLPVVCWESCEACPPDTIDDTSIRELASLGTLNIFPNPANDQVTVTTEHVLSGVVQTNVVNALGQTVISTQTSGSNNTILDVSGLQNGFYMIMVRSEAGQSTSKFLISR